MDKQIEKVIQHIKDLENRLGYVDNNLHYIKVIQALKYWLEKFADLLSNNQALQREYQATYLSYFYTGCGFSFHSMYFVRAFIPVSAPSLHRWAPGSSNPPLHSIPFY